MSVDLISHFEDEAAQIQKKMQALQERADLVATIIKELRSASGSSPRKAPAVAAKKPASKPEAPKAKGRSRKKRGGITVRDAIMKTVSGASEALTAGAILADAVRLSQGAEASVRTQINTLTKEGLLKQVPYAGRGFKYGPGDGPKKAAKKK